MRIIIFGRPGSGKSTFAVELSEKLNLPVYHIDKIFFETRWKIRQRENFLSLLNKWMAQDEWIIDGNALSTLNNRFSLANIAIYFDLPWYICLWRLLKRVFQSKDHGIDDLPTGTKSCITWGIIKFKILFRRKFKNEIRAIIKMYPHIHFFHVRKCGDVKKLFNKLNYIE